MSNTSTEYASVSPIIELASQGKYYKSGSGQAEVVPLDGDHESMFAEADAQTFPQILDKVLRECTVKLPVEDFSKLLIGDKSHLMFHLRMVSYRKYGNIYKFQVTCPACKGVSPLSVDLLKDVVIQHPPENAVEPFDVFLPYCGKTVQMRLMRVQDEAEMVRFVRDEKAKKKAKHPNALPGDPAYIYAMAAGIVSIDGEPMDIGMAIQFVRKCKGEDTLALRDALDKYDVGPEFQRGVTCPDCGNHWYMRLPLDVDFFRPGSTDRRIATLTNV